MSQAPQLRMPAGDEDPALVSRGACTCQTKGAARAHQDLRCRSFRDVGHRRDWTISVRSRRHPSGQQFDCSRIGLGCWRGCSPRFQRPIQDEGCNIRFGPVARLHPPAQDVHSARRGDVHHLPELHRHHYYQSGVRHVTILGRCEYWAVGGFCADCYGWLQCPNHKVGPSRISVSFGHSQVLLHHQRADRRRGEPLAPDGHLIQPSCVPGKRNRLRLTCSTVRPRRTSGVPSRGRPRSPET